MSELSQIDALSSGCTVLLVSMLLALPITFVLTLDVIRRFRKRVKRSMDDSAKVGKRDGAAFDLVAHPILYGKGALERSKLVERSTSGTALGELKIKQIDVTIEQTRAARVVPLVTVARRRERRLAKILTLAACAHPLILAAFIVGNSYRPYIENQVTRFVLLYSSFFLVTATPVALAATMILTKQLRFQALSILALIATFRLFDWAIGGSSLVVLWLMFAGLPTGVILVLNVRSVRAVGPIVFAATLLFFCAVVAGQFYGALYMWDVIGPVHFVREDLAQLPLLTAAKQYLDEALTAPAEAISALMSQPSSIIRADHPERLTSGYKLLFASISLLSIVIGAAAGWAFVRWLAARYQNRRSSDQMLTIDVLMAVFTISAFLVFYTTFNLTGAISALAGFGGYKLLMHWQLRPRIGFVSPEGAPTLLLLRVFRSNRTGQPLLEKIMQRWRYLGPVRLLAGTDFADSIIEPHEFFEFLSRRLSRAFVKDLEDLEHRISRHVPGPDPDGLYRIEDFFCHRDTWKMTATYLAKQADLVLMDLRGFSSANEGCTFEIAMLLNFVPVNRVVFVADRSTDSAYVEETLQFAWNTLPSTSPNAKSGQHQVSLIQAPDHQHTVDGLLGLLCEKAQQVQPATPLIEGGGSVPKTGKSSDQRS